MKLTSTQPCNFLLINESGLGGGRSHIFNLLTDVTQIVRWTWFESPANFAGLAWVLTSRWAAGEKTPIKRVFLQVWQPLLWDLPIFEALFFLYGRPEPCADVLCQ
jgi:hypothetical protein